MGFLSMVGTEKISRELQRFGGGFICLGKSILHTESFEVMRALIATDTFHSIEREILLYLKNEGYRVKIMEVGPAARAIHQNH